MMLFVYGLDFHLIQQELTDSLLVEQNLSFFQKASAWFWLLSSLACIFELINGIIKFYKIYSQRNFHRIHKMKSEETNKSCAICTLHLSSSTYYSLFFSLFFESLILPTLLILSPLFNLISLYSIVAPMLSPLKTIETLSQMTAKIGNIQSLVGNFSNLSASYPAIKDQIATLKDSSSFYTQQFNSLASSYSILNEKYKNAYKVLEYSRNKNYSTFLESFNNLSDNLRLSIVDENNYSFFGPLEVLWSSKGSPFSCSFAPLGKKVMLAQFSNSFSVIGPTGTYSTILNNNFLIKKIDSQFLINQNSTKIIRDSPFGFIIYLFYQEDGIYFALGHYDSNKKELIDYIFTPSGLLLNLTNRFINNNLTLVFTDLYPYSNGEYKPISALVNLSSNITPDSLSPYGIGDLPVNYINPLSFGDREAVNLNGQTQIIDKFYEKIILNKNLLSNIYLPSFSSSTIINPYIDVDGNTQSSSDKLFTSSFPTYDANNNLIGFIYINLANSLHSIEINKLIVTDIGWISSDNSTNISFLPLFLN